MTGPLDGLVALVTGGSSGIGEATASALAEAGATVAVVARRPEQLAAVVEDIKVAGGSAVAVVADLADETQAAGAVTEVVRDLGRLDIVVNCAGVMLLGPVAGADPVDWTRMIDLNLRGLMAVSHSALPHLLDAAASSERRVSDLVNVSSVAGRVIFPAGAVYNATKFGVGAFSEALRQEVTSRHVRVSVVEPGATATDLLTHNSPEVQAGDAERFAGLTRLSAADVADAIAYVVTRPRHVAVNELLVRPTEEV